MSPDGIMAAGENRSSVGLGKVKTMHETNGVEFATAHLATAHLATDITFHYAERAIK
jgi:hypothetical protein